MNLNEEYEKWVEEYSLYNKTDEAHIDDVAFAAFRAGFKFGAAPLTHPNKGNANVCACEEPEHGFATSGGNSECRKCLKQISAQR
jgi:hypothetical protein